MKIQEKQVQLLGRLEQIQANYSEIWQDQAIDRQLKNLREDIENDFFTIVVLGEFKRGKSTFINALIKEKLLPADVTPTTATINALMYDEKRRAFIIDHEGGRQEGEADHDFLNQYIAGSVKDISQIKYLQIGLPSKLLNPNVVLVDTPGVSDINEQRVQVTYDFIPRADVVVFLLDATAPVKRTEKEFIEEHFIKIGVEQILFVANKMDYIDEEEEEEVLEDIEMRLKKCFKKVPGLESPKVLPLSASLALQGALKGDRALQEASGITAVEDAVYHMIYEGTKIEQREKRYEAKLQVLADLIKKDLQSQYQVAQMDQSRLIEVLKKIEGIKEEEKERKYKLNQYIENQREDLLSMTQKSLYYFRDNLTQEMLDMVQMYKGTDFKEFVEMQLSTAIKKNMQRWVSTYSLSIEKALDQLGRQVAKGLSTHFKQRVILEKGYLAESEQMILQNAVVIEADDISYVTTQAGLISASMAGVITLIGGPVIMPFISMAAFPLLQRKMLEGKLKEAKINVKPELVGAINQSVQLLYKEIEANITSRITQLQNASEDRYEQLITLYQQRLEEEIQSRREDTVKVSSRMQLLSQRMEQLQQLITIQ